MKKTRKSTKTKESGPEPKNKTVLREKAESRLREQSGRLDELSEKDIRQLAHELATYQIELEMQNEELRRVQNDLEESRSRYSDLYDFSPAGYFTFDKNGLILEVNLTGATLLAVDRSSLINRPFSSFVIRDCRNVFRGHCSEVLKKHILQTCEIKLMKKDGAEFQVHLQSIPVIDSEGNAVYCRTALTDITERKEAEEALRASYERYRSYIELTGQLGWTTNADGEVVEDLLTWRKYTGQTYEEIKGWGWSKALHPEDREQTRLAWEKAVTAKSIYEIEHRIRRHDGIYRHFLTRGVPIHKEDGSIREWVGTSTDISAYKQTEEKIRHLASFPQFNPNPVIEIDFSGKVIYANPAVQKILKEIGIDKGDVEVFLPKDLGDIMRDWDRKSESSHYREVAIKDRIFGENIYLNPDFNLARIYSLDITERKKADMEISRRVEELNAANEELTRFNNAAVGRELRMIELKKEINDLCAGFGKPPRYVLDFEKEGG